MGPFGLQGLCRWNGTLGRHVEWFCFLSCGEEKLTVELMSGKYNLKLRVRGKREWGMEGAGEKRTPSGFVFAGSDQAV